MDKRSVTEVACRITANLLIGLALAILFTLPFIGCPIEIKGPEGPRSTPTPTPLPPTPPIPPTPPPTPTGGDIAQGVEWDLVSPRPSAQFTEQINSTLSKLTGCEPQSRCVVNKPMDVFLAMEVQELRLLGLFAGIQPGADEVCVGARPNDCQGYHVYTCSATCDKGTVGWASGSVRDTWHTRETQQPPTPPPATSPTCPRLGRIKLDVRQQTRLIVDATPQTDDRDWCNANGFPGRVFCPMGEEGGSSRPVCEAQAGPYSWATSAGGTFFTNNNPLQVVVTSHQPGETIRVTGGNGVVGEAVLP